MICLDSIVDVSLCLGRTVLITRREIHFLVRDRSPLRCAHEQRVGNNSTPMRSPNMQRTNRQVRKKTQIFGYLNSTKFIKKM